MLFLLYLVLPQTQGARILYQDHVHPFLEENEGQIDNFIGSTHDRLRAEGLAYIRHAIEYIKTNILKFPPTPAAPEPAAYQSYSQALFARFSVPTAKWSGSANGGADFYNLLAGAVAAASGAAGTTFGGGGGADAGRGGIFPADMQTPSEKMSFIAAQRDRLNFVLSALDNEAQKLQRGEADHTHSTRATSMSYDGIEDDDGPTQRPSSGLSMGGGLVKNRSEADFETIDADSLTDDEVVRRRNAPAAGGGSWMPWNWGGAGAAAPDAGASSGVER